MTRTDYVMKDMAKSNAVMKLYEPLLCKLLKCDHIKAVEGVNNEICKLLDLTCGIDYLEVEDRTGRVIGIANRVQWIAPPYPPYNTFTIRTSRESGAETEFTKRVKAIERGGIYPRLTMHTYADKETNEILSLAIAETKDVIRYIQKHNPQIRSVRDESGWAEFYCCKWNDMIDKGYKLLRYEACFGDKFNFALAQVTKGA